MFLFSLSHVQSGKVLSVINSYSFLCESIGEREKVEMRTHFSPLFDPVTMKYFPFSILVLNFCAPSSAAI